MGIVGPMIVRRRGRIGAGAKSGAANLPARPRNTPRAIFVFLALSFLWHPASVWAKHTASRVIYGPTQLYVTLKGLRQFYVIDRNDPTQVRRVPVD